MQAKAPAKKKRGCDAAAASATVPAQPEEDDEDSIEQDLMDVDWEVRASSLLVLCSVLHVRVPLTASLQSGLQQKTHHVRATVITHLGLRC
jgi:hypothetical protein